MGIGQHVRPLSWLLCLILAGLLFQLFACQGLFNSDTDHQTTPSDFQATAEAERVLIVEHGSEVRSQIENFESRWFSLEAHLDPGIQSELATGPYLEYFGNARQGASLYDEPFWLVTTAAVVGNLRVLEYSPERFKAVACSVETTDKMTTDGVFIESLPPLDICGVYVFVREDDKWKLAGFFNTADPRDWNYAPNWLKEIIGDLPNEDLYKW